MGTPSGARFCAPDGFFCQIAENGAEFITFTKICQEKTGIFFILGIEYFARICYNTMWIKSNQGVGYERLSLRLLYAGGIVG